MANGFSERSACRLILVNRSACQYEPLRRRGDVTRARMREVAETRVRYGCRRIHVLLQREGWEVKANRMRAEAVLGARSCLPRCGSRALPHDPARHERPSFRASPGQPAAGGRRARLVRSENGRGRGGRAQGVRRVPRRRLYVPAGPPRRWPAPSMPLTPSSSCAAAANEAVHYRSGGLRPRLHPAPGREQRSQRAAISRKRSISAMTGPDARFPASSTSGPGPHRRPRGGRRLFGRRALAADLFVMLALAPTSSPVDGEVEKGAISEAASCSRKSGWPRRPSTSTLFGADHPPCIPWPTIVVDRLVLCMSHLWSLSGPNGR